MENESVEVEPDEMAVENLDQVNEVIDPEEMVIEDLGEVINPTTVPPIGTTDI